MYGVGDELELEMPIVSEPCSGPLVSMRSTCPSYAGNKKALLLTKLLLCYFFTSDGKREKCSSRNDSVFSNVVDIHANHIIHRR